MPQTFAILPKSFATRSDSEESNTDFPKAKNKPPKIDFTPEKQTKIDFTPEEQIEITPIDFEEERPTPTISADKRGWGSRVMSWVDEISEKLRPGTDIEGAFDPETQEKQKMFGRQMAGVVTGPAEIAAGLSRVFGSKDEGDVRRYDRRALQGLSEAAGGVIDFFALPAMIGAPGVSKAAEFALLSETAKAAELARLRNIIAMGSGKLASEAKGLFKLYTEGAPQLSVELAKRMPFYIGAGEAVGAGLEAVGAPPEYVEFGKLAVPLAADVGAARVRGRVKEGQRVRRAEEMKDVQGRSQPEAQGQTLGFEPPPTERIDFVPEPAPEQARAVQAREQQRFEDFQKGQKRKATIEELRAQERAEIEAIAKMHEEAVEVPPKTTTEPPAAAVPIPEAPKQPPVPPKGEVPLATEPGVRKVTEADLLAAGARWNPAKQHFELPDGSSGYINNLGQFQKTTPEGRIREVVSPPKPFEGTEAQAIAEARRSNSKPAPLSPIAEAKAFAAEIAEGRSVDDVAKLYGGIKTTQVEDRLALNNLAPALQDLVRQGMFKENMATALGKLAGRFKLPEGIQVQIFDNVVKKYELTPKELTELVDQAAPAAQSGIQTSLFGAIERGFVDVFMELKKAQKELLLAQTRWRGPLKEITAKEKRGEALTPALKRVKGTIQEELRIIQSSIEEKTRELGEAAKPKSLKEEGIAFEEAAPEEASVKDTSTGSMFSGFDPWGTMKSLGEGFKKEVEELKKDTGTLFGGFDPWGAVKRLYGDYQRGGGKEPAPKREQPVTKEPEPVRQVQERIDDASTRIRQLSEQHEKIFGLTETVAETGTAQPKEIRPEIRWQGRKPDTMKVSPRLMEELNATLVGSKRILEQARKDAVNQADRGTNFALRLATERFENVALEWQRARQAWGRTGHVMQRAVTESLVSELQSIGISVGKIKATSKPPILVDIRNVIQQARTGEITKARAMHDIGKDLLQYLTINLFPIGSFSLDMFTNSIHAEIKAPGMLAGDLYDVVTTGRLSLPRTAGLIRAIKEGKGFKQMTPEMEARLGRSASGEIFEPLGLSQVAEKMPKPLAQGIERVAMLPLWMKQGIDGWSKRTFAQAQLYADASAEASRMGYKGLARERFVEEFLKNTPDWAFERAVKEGNKAGFNRELSIMEERIASNGAIRLFVDAYPRWAFQFARWSGEMLGIRPELWRRIRKGEATGAEVAQYLTETATGWGGVYLVNGLYEGVDFNTMEYKREDGNRVRLSGRTPIPEALMLIAMLRGDWENAHAALAYTSMPFAKGVEGGLAGGLISSSRDLHTGAINTERFRREMIDLVNKMIPGQGVLKAVNSVFVDPVLREGVGAVIPGVSLLYPPRIKATTGEPLAPRQKFLGVEMPSFGGIVVPGATRVMDRVEKALIDHGIGTFRPRRTPLAEFSTEDVPDELRQRYEEIAGKLVNEYVSEELDAEGFEELEFEERQRLLLDVVNEARQEAREILAEERGTEEIPKVPTRRERLMPRR